MGFLDNTGLTRLWEHIMTNLNDKVTKVTGKDLSTNDYTDEDKTKLSGIETGANNYTHPTSHPASMITGLSTVATSGSYNDLSDAPTIPTVGNGTITITQAGSTKGTFTTNQNGDTTIDLTDTNTDTNTTYSLSKSGSTITLTGSDGTTTSVTDSDSDTTYSAATTSADGLMSSSDKAKLDTITEDADSVSYEASATSGNKVGTITINGVATDMYSPTQTTVATAESASSTIGITTSGDGAAYTATVSGISSLTAGVSFIMIPHVVSTSQTPTLNVNDLGAKNIRRRISNSTTTTTVGYNASWLAANKPIRVMYDGSFWIAEIMCPNAVDMYGTLAITKGGTGATTAAEAITSLGIDTYVAEQIAAVADYNSVEV